MGCVFLVSVVFGRPMFEKLALEFSPLHRMLACPALVRTLLPEPLVGRREAGDPGTTLTLLSCCGSLAAYVALKQHVMLAITGAVVALTIDRAV